MKKAFVLLTTGVTLFTSSLFAQIKSDNTAVKATNAAMYDLNEKQLSQSGGVMGALSMFPGSTVQSGGKLQFRGLSPRYTSAYVDGILAPSTETSTKAFAFGIIPGSAISNMQIYTGGYAGVTGEFGGAAVSMNTNASVKKNWNKFSLSFGYMPMTHGHDFYRPDNYGGAADYFGFGVNKRDYTKDIASSDELQNMTRNQAAAEGAKLENVWGVDKGSALPNMKLSYFMGRNIKTNGNAELSTVNGITFSKDRKTAYDDRYSYTGYTLDGNGDVDGSSMKYFNNNTAYKESTKTNVVSNWNLVLNPKNNLKFSNILTHSADNMFSTRHGFDYDNQYERLVYATDYIAKTVYLSRLNGSHILDEADRTQLDWALGYSFTNRKEPDYRVAGGQRNLGGTEDYYLLIPRSSKADAGSRYASELYEHTYSSRADLSHDFSGDKEGATLKAGMYMEFSNRDFRSRLTSFAQDENTDFELRYPSIEAIGTVFDPSNFSENGYYLIDGTRPSDQYDASSQLFAEYVGVDLPFNKNNELGVGVRVETFNQALDSDTISVDNSATNALPYLNFSSNELGGGRLQFAYSMSINRPAFRELAPFSYYDFEWRTDVTGNSELVNTEIQNIEVNYTHALGQAGSFSGSVFYKYLANPIEKSYRIRSESPMFSFENSKSAQLAGISVQVNTKLSADPASFLSKMNLMVNASYIYSDVELSENSQESSTSRSLQGQAPYTVNAVLGYQWNKTNIGMIYNTSGKSLFAVGDGQETYPWYLMPMHNVSLSVNSQLTDQISLSLSANNIANAKPTFYEDANMDGKIDKGTGADKLIRETEVGPSFKIGLKYKF